MEPPSAAPRELPRLLGPFSAASIVIGSIIGSGVFMKPQVVAQSLPSPGWILVCWAAAGLLSLIGCLAFAEMSALYPQAGGQYVYLREAFGRLPAFLFGWANITIINAASIAALAFISAEYLANVAGFGLAKDSGEYQAVAVGFIFLLTAANAVGVLWGARIQNVLTTLKLLALAAIIFGMFLPGRAQPGVLSPFWEIRGEGTGSILSGFKAAFIAIFWAYDGWYLLSFSGGEIKDPRRNIPLGFTLGILVVITVYVLANLAYLTAIPVEEMGVQTGALGGVGAEVARRFYGSLGLTMISVGVLGSTLGALNGNILTGPRLFYAMARDGLFFRPFGVVHPRFLTPLNSIVVQGILGALCIFAGNFDDLTDSVVFAAWIFYGLAVSGLFFLRRRRGAPREGEFRMPGYPVLPAVFVVFAAVFVIYNAWDAGAKVSGALEACAREGTLSMKGLYPLLVAGVLLLGVPLFLLFRGREAGGPPVIRTPDGGAPPGP